MIQWRTAWADQPYQNRPTPRRRVPGAMTGIRNSGFPCPPFRFDKARYMRSMVRLYITVARPEAVAMET
jgi:hypothetical protein